ncbi:hypothetical protein CSUB01_06468 [Colletotrichum sublineola]|uniref:Transcription factor domain-containing protein n=1 Tax=Colletotrichum sublineola TaxID=1173701 RepID=A0A066XES5_COLSU|nr:hypothetical protein CSUB01_06468 [Colletotrichum sublineola]
METDHIPLGDGPSDKPNSTSLKRKRKPRAPVACGTCRARKIKVGLALPMTMGGQRKADVDDVFPSVMADRHAPIVSTPNETPRRETPFYGSLVGIQKRLQPQPIPQQPQPVCQSQPTPLPRAILPDLLHTSPASSDEPIKHEPPPQPTLQEHGRVERGSTASSEQEVDGLGQVNEHTEGAEFYGPTGTFYFLARLRSRANTQNKPDVGVSKSQSSIVNLLHSSDYSTPPDSRVLDQSPYAKSSPQSTVARKESLQQGAAGAHALLSAADASLATDIERECARLYFQNLHNIHPILEQTAFLRRCEEEIWSRPLRPDILACPQMRREARFLALYNVVVAIGAITAGETSLFMEDHTREFLDRTGQQPGEDDALYPPIRLARRFFERSRLQLEDICESSSLETAQTLFLMWHGHQNSLRHGNPNQDSLRNKSGELTMVLFPNSAYCLINPMVDLAKILMWMTDNLSVHNNHTSLQRLSQTALSLERDLEDWRSGLPRQLRFDMSSLEDSDFAMKQKTVLKLQADPNMISRHVTSCIEAATETIKFMHTSYLHRPYIRTWWYNCMYLLDACMVLLHVLISNICPFPADEVMENIELSLEIFRAMKMLAVARRCADIVRELLHVATRTHSGRQRRSDSATVAEAGSATKVSNGNDDGGGGNGSSLAAYTMPAITSSSEGAWPLPGGAEFGDAVMIPGDMDANLVDPNVVWNFLNFEHWNAWSDAAFK